MTRLLCALAGITIAAMLLLAAAWGALKLMPVVQNHMMSGWFVPACNLFTAFCLVLFVLQRRRAKIPENQTPRWF